MFYARSGGYPDDVEARVSRKQRAVDNKESPEGGLSQPDNSAFVEATVLPLKATYTPVPEPQHIPGLASPTQPPSPVDATSLYAFALGTFPTSLLLFIVLRGTRGRDNRALNNARAIPVTVTTYLDLVDRQHASMSPQFTDGEYTDSLFSQSTLPSPRPDDEPLDPRDPAAPQAPGVPAVRHNPREGFLGEWEAAFKRAFDRILRHDDDDADLAADDESSLSFFLRILFGIGDTGLWGVIVGAMFNIVMVGQFLYFFGYYLPFRSAHVNDYAPLM